MITAQEADDDGPISNRWPQIMEDQNNEASELPHYKSTSSNFVYSVSANNHISNRSKQGI